MSDTAPQGRYETRADDPRTDTELLTHAKQHGDPGAREVLLGRSVGLRAGRRFFNLLPSSPRCKLCASPFQAPLGPLMKLIGKGPWPRNPAYCSMCFKQMTAHRAGAEIESSFLFADVRGSTGLAEQMSPGEFQALMSNFLNNAAEIVNANDGIIDKFVGDEIVAMFIPAMSGDEHAAGAVRAARQLVRRAARHGLPVGAGVNTGVAFVGAVGEGAYTEFTAMGDPVNVAARLAAAAAAGEVLVTLGSAQQAHLELADLEHRRLDLKGKSAPVDVVAVPAEAIVA